jgi:hypothetical protein
VAYIVAQKTVPMFSFLERLTTCNKSNKLCNSYGIPKFATVVLSIVHETREELDVVGEPRVYIEDTGE